MSFIRLMFWWNWASFCSNNFKAATFFLCSSCSCINVFDFGVNSFLKSDNHKKGITEPIKCWCQNLDFHKLKAIQKRFSQSSSFWKMITKLFVNGSLCGFPLFIPLLSMNKCGSAYIVPLRCVLLIKLSITLDLRLAFCYPLISSEMQVCSTTFRIINFSKEKKEKKKAVFSSGRFQKNKFF